MMNSHSSATAASGPRHGRRTAHRARDRARPGAGRLGRRGPLPQLARRGAKTPPPRSRALGRRAVLLDCDLADEAAVRALLARAADALGPIGCVVNNASLFDYDSAADFSPALLAAHMQANVSAPILLAQALHAATPAGSAGGGDQPAGPEAGQPESRFSVVHAVEGGAAHRHHDAGAGAGADRARGRRGARPDHGVGRAERSRLRQRAPGHAARADRARRKTSPTPSATWPRRAPSPAPPYSSTAAST